MKFNIDYSTTGKKWINEHMYQHIGCKVSLNAVAIYRYPCGSGAAAKRYYYRAKFVAPNDAGFPADGFILEGINRKANKHFKPKDFDWIDNKAVI